MHRLEGKIVGLLAIAALACACAGRRTAVDSDQPLSLPTDAIAAARAGP